MLWEHCVISCRGCRRWFGINGLSIEPVGRRKKNADNVVVGRGRCRGHELGLSSTICGTPLITWVPAQPLTVGDASGVPRFAAQGSHGELS